MKVKRQAKILELVREQEIETQGELTKLLSAAGFNTTQATVSRDIHEMKLTKIAAAKGGYKYALPAQQDQGSVVRLKRVFWDGYVSMDNAGNMVVIRTFDGMARAVAAALDAVNLPEVVGSIAGNDVVMCATKSEQAAIDLMEKLKRVMQ